MKTRKISIATQLFIFILGTAIIASLVVGGVSYSTMENYLKQKTMDSVLEIAVIAAENVDGETFVKAMEGDEDALLQIKESLEFFLTGESVTYIYTLMPKDQENFQFVLDTDPEDPGEYGEDYEAQDEMFDAMKGEASVTKEPFTDEWGTFYSGFAPIKYDGKVQGIVAVDYQASSIKTSLSSLVKNIAVALAIGILFSLLAAALIAIKMRHNFNKVNDKINEVVSSEGDLTKLLEITSGDEFEVIGNSLNGLINKTGNTVQGIKIQTGSIESKMEDINSHVVGSVSRITGISDTIQSMVASSEEISASVGTVNEQIESLYTDIQSMVDIVSENTDNLRDINKSSAELANTTESSTAMINENIESMSKNLREEKTKADAVLRISELSDTILNISSQTNMLALNASIEAARAGEAGRGFTVVAEQIGTLAGNTNEAANEIQKMSKEVVEAIKGLDNLAEQMLNLMHEKISADYEQFGSTSHGFSDKSDNIWSSMNKLKEITEKYAATFESIKNAMASITSASEENTNEILHMSEMLSSMDSDMKNISVSTEETFSAISDINRDLRNYRPD